MSNVRNDDDENERAECIIHLGLGRFSATPSSSSNSGLKKKCHLCLRMRQTFFCQDCVEKGNFTHSTARYPERFADKKLRFYGLTEEIKEYNKQIADAWQKKKEIANLNLSIHQHKERIKLLHLSIKEISEKLSRQNFEKEKLENDNEEQRLRTPRTAERLQKMARYYQSSQERIKTKKENLEVLNSSVKKVKADKIMLMLTYVFPVSIVFPSKSDELSSSDGPMQELAEAQQLSFIHGHWVVEESQQVQYKILDAYLPESGNYSDYNEWVLRNKESPSAGSIMGNPANRISAALTHTAQLVILMSHFLDVRLPKNLCYSEFCGHELNEKQFALKVAKLNINIINLCLSQNVNSKLLSPKTTMKNLMYLFDPEVADLGRHGPHEMSYELVTNMLQSLFEDMNFATDDEEDEKITEFDDWETLPLPTFEPLALPTKGSSSVTTIVHVQARPRQNPQTTSTLGGGLISSVASLWRAATGQK